MLELPNKATEEVGVLRRLLECMEWTELSRPAELVAHVQGQVLDFGSQRHQLVFHFYSV